MTYYQQELMSVLEKNAPATMKIKIQGTESATKWLDLTPESIEDVQSFLAELKTIWFLHN